MDWLLRRLADRLGVSPPQAGEAIEPHLRFEQPWPQWLALVLFVGAAALIVWLYRREGSAPLGYRLMLAALRIGLVLLAMFMLSEAVLSVERTGLPYFVILADDSASTAVVDQFADPKAMASATDLARVAGADEPRRFAVAQGWLMREGARLLRDLVKQHKVRLYLMDSSARPLAEIDATAGVEPALLALGQVEPDRPESRLGEAVRDVLNELRGVPPTALLLLTDGQTTDGESLAKAADLARSKGVPLIAVGLGDPEPARDLELTDLMVDEVVFLDDQVRFEARLIAKGFQGQDVTVRLKRRDPSSPGDEAEEVGQVHVAAPPDGQPKRVEITHRPERTGEVTYILEVDPRPRELQEENNRVERTVNVREEKLRVLVVEGEPRYEYRYLLSFLKREKTIDLATVLQSSDPEYSEQESVALPTFPTAQDGPGGLFSFDVVLLGDVDLSLLNAAQMQNLVEFVTKKGGGLLFLAGEVFNPLSYRGTPLEALLPIQLSEARNPSAVGAAVAGYRPSLTAEGRAHPIFRLGNDEAEGTRIWETILPDLYWFLEAPRKQPAAFVLATHPSLTGSDGPLPLVLYQFVGAGKVMFQAYDDTWRWRFRVGDRYFGRYWIQTVRFLARSKLLGQKQAEVSTDRRRYERRQPIRVRVRFPNPALAPPSGEVMVQVERRGKGPRRLKLSATPGTPNVFEGALPQAAEGEYEVRLLPPPVLDGSVPTTTFRVEPPAGELERVQRNDPELIRAATASRGRFFTPSASIDQVLKALPAPRKVPLDTDPPIPLWNTPALLALFLAMLTAEWVLRKRKQMV